MTDTKVFLNTTFTGYKKDTSFISMALVTSENEVFYVESNLFDDVFDDYLIEKKIFPNLLFLDERARASKMDNFIYSQAKLSNFFAINPKYNKYSPIIKNKQRSRFDEFATREDTFSKIGMLIAEWLEQFGQTQIVGNCCSYDWMLFCRLFAGGRELYLPSFISPCPHDINQDIARYLDISDRDAFLVDREEFAGVSKSNGSMHNAVWNAEIIKACWNKIH